MTSDIKEVSVPLRSTAPPSTSAWQVCNVTPPTLPPPETYLPLAGSGSLVHQPHAYVSRRHSEPAKRCSDDPSEVLGHQPKVQCVGSL